MHDRHISDRKSREAGRGGREGGREGGRMGGREDSVLLLVSHGCVCHLGHRIDH